MLKYKNLLCINLRQGNTSTINNLNMSNWLEHSVQIEVEIPIEQVWELWSDLKEMPKWMKWIDSVEILDDDPNLSRWKLVSGGFQFTWISKILKVVPNQIIQWESVNGLPNRGAIRFYDRQGSSIVRLTIAYSIPGWLGKLMDNLFLGQIVESTILEDLKRFKNYALKKNKNRI
ncbi:polyketide cyclase / dehydrase family protein [Candidatus Atelocyanobacterium thalassa isolate ALOHA]|uniref:Polyketide cyclase / dehydrase family protein n=2 Tax=Candidatus Atelocyanobacterium thalassae TaxID=713887 RepID=D3EQ49_ATETH|nr:polyketide cyclase / dehydrase family protein [Candidatus Atelocyanobacterium thalassa isolate ALOHA]|tara:strand:+ start:37842 stop:38363 length:522 start_codon:yes stop_codon:yes gene_type:complete